ncbi:ribosomal protein S17 [Actinidia rufa]|uniref:Ribosomal protein S17 n=1 Tax=Actinidia rufa TaxID=165716 RepID=A0A7J0H8T8_9ERIC|nr:ribosomal protein S17 [Actinidia rufa]
MNGDEGLGLANGSTLLELDIVADLELVVGVVGLELLLLSDPTLVLGAWGEAHDLDGVGWTLSCRWWSTRRGPAATSWLGSEGGRCGEE